MSTKNPGCIKIFLSYKMVYNEIPRPLHPWPMGLSFSLLLEAPLGLEPRTYRLTVCCSNQLS